MRIDGFRAALGRVVAAEARRAGVAALSRRAHAESRELRATTVLIVGESGTGKEVLARELHRRSPRGHRPLLQERRIRRVGGNAPSTSMSA